MQSEPSIRRYRNVYINLLRLFPKPYHDRFGEGMEQTFTDLLQERAQEDRNLFSHALWMYLETSAGIIKENKTLITMPLKNLLRIVLVVAGLLLIPFLMMQFNIPFFDPGSGFDEGVNWTLSDFVMMGGLLLIAGIGLDLVFRKAGKYKAVAIIGIVVAFLWLWAELAVGVFTNWGS